MAPVAEVSTARNLRRAALRGSGGSAPSLVAFAIVCVWAISTVGDILSSTYNTPEGVSSLALAAATFLFGSAFRRENSDHE